MNATKPSWTLKYVYNMEVMTREELQTLIEEFEVLGEYTRRGQAILAIINWCQMQGQLEHLRARIQELLGE